jgi:uncharacterized protein (TIGR02270 family)
VGTEPPIRWDVVEEHLDEAAFLHAQWERALCDPEYVLATAAEGPEERMLAHLDGLVVAGRRAAEKLLLPALAGDDLDVVFAAAWALLASEDGDYTVQVLDVLLKAEPEPAAAIGRALQLVPRQDALPRVASVLAGAAPPAQAALLDVLAHRRLDAGLRIDPFLTSADPGVRKAALRLARVFPRGATPALLERALGSKDTTERDTALATGLVVGLASAWPTCSRLVHDGGPAWSFPALVYGLSGEAELMPLTAGLTDPLRRRAALFALGFTGRIAAAEALLPWLGDKKDGGVAGEALSAITGVVLKSKLAKPAKRWNPEEPEAAEQETGPESDLPVPEPVEVERWWAEAKRTLDRSVRLAGGRPWSGEALLDALEHGPMRRREALALDLAVRTRGQAQVTWDRASAAQWAQLAEARAGASRISSSGYRGAAR